MNTDKNLLLFQEKCNSSKISPDLLMSIKQLTGWTVSIYTHYEEVLDHFHTSQNSVDIFLWDVRGSSVNPFKVLKVMESFVDSVYLLCLEDANRTDRLQQFFSLGAWGVISQDDLSNLSGIFDRVLDQEPVISASFRYWFYNFFRPSQSVEILGTLGAREIEILRYISTGTAIDQISDQLCISVHTLKTHLKNLHRKLQANNRVQLIHNAVQLGIISFQKESSSKSTQQS